MTPSPKPSPSVTVAPELLKPPIQSKDISDEFAKTFQALDCSTNEPLSGVLDDEAKYLITCEEGNAYNGGEGSDDVWEYALVDYRDNNITVVPVPTA